MRNYNFKNKKGFTLLEALVAISILMVAVTAPITIAQKGLSSAVYSKDQMIASYLAQDAIEYIKNKRDELSINNDYEWQGLSPFAQSGASCLDGNSCDIDTISGDIIPFSASTPLKKDNNNFYGHGATASTTKYTREIKITINPNGNADEALVDVKVDWGGGKNYVDVKTLIYNY